MLRQKEKEILSLISSKYSEYWDEYYLEPGEVVRIKEDRLYYFDCYETWNFWPKQTRVCKTLKEFLQYYLGQRSLFQLSTEDIKAVLELLEEEDFPDVADIQQNGLQSSVGKLKISLRSKLSSEEDESEERELWKGKYQKGYLRTKNKQKVRKYWKRKARAQGKEEIREYQDE